MESSSRPNLQMFFSTQVVLQALFVCLFVYFCFFFFPVQRGGMVNLHIICVLLYYKDVESSLLENSKKNKKRQGFFRIIQQVTATWHRLFRWRLKKRCVSPQIQRKIRNAVGADDKTKGIVRFSNLQSGETLFVGGTISPYISIYIYI